MTKKLLKNKYFIILSIIVIVLIIIKIFYSGSSNNKPSTTTNPTPTLTSKDNQDSKPSSTNSNSNTTPTPTKNINITEVNYQIPLYNLLPYQGKYFQVKRYLKANNLELIVYRKADTELAKQEAQEWLVKNGVGSIDTFTVVY